MTQQLLNNEEIVEDEIVEDETADYEIVNELDASHLAIEDDTPVDNFQSAQQQRLLVDQLYSTQVLPLPFIAEANVGLFYKIKGDPVVPDVMLSLGVQRAEDLSQRQNRAYFVWEFGKVPDVCVEVVSNREGDEIGLIQRSLRKGKKTGKKDIYSWAGIPYYVVFDPLQQIQDEAEMNGALLRIWTIASGQYTELTPAEGIAEVGSSAWLETVGLGLTLWRGAFEEAVPRLWLRWCDRQGQIIPTGAERANAEQRRADTEQQRVDIEQQRAERLAERLRTLGINPDEV